MRNTRKHKRSKHKRSKHKHSNTHKKNKGGKAIDAGSYGCVFRPALKCADSQIPYDSKYVSKLMFKEHIGKEMAEINKVKKIIEKIPGNDKYFLVTGTYNCKPTDLSPEDLIDFDDKCGLFTKNNINSANINNALNDLELINIPDGGITVDKYFYNLLTTKESKSSMYASFKKINNSLIKLLTNGIVPINHHRLNHYDIKGDNILITPDGEQARLIDWGLSGENDGKTIPKDVKNSTITFNLPFSNIFFNDDIKTWLPAEFARIKSENNNDGQSELIKIIAMNLLNKTLSDDIGHFKEVIHIALHDIYKIYALDNGHNEIDYDVLAYNTIIEYIHAVILKFADENGHFDDVKYFYEVFSKNVDIWGFLTCYTSVIQYGVHYDMANKEYILDKELIHVICRILIKYCFSTEYATKAINVSELVKELTTLGGIPIGQNSERDLGQKLGPRLGSRIGSRLGH